MDSQPGVGFFETAVFFKRRIVQVIEVYVGTPVVARRAGPVSYTHLRAHETVLDLVCRLLLETKKNNKKTHKKKKLT